MQKLSVLHYYDKQQGFLPLSPQALSHTVTTGLLKLDLAYLVLYTALSLEHHRGNECNREKERARERERERERVRHQQIRWDMKG